ncbi:MAG: endonuclease [Bacteroidia bacterium]|nr:endonuclease [Bacteroidia bacterium]
MKQIYLLALLISSLSFAQIPANYYDSANGLSGYALKTELKNIISNGHQARLYDQLYDGNGIPGSNGYIDTHSDVAVASGNNYENDGTILDMYSEFPFGPDDYNYTHGVNQCGNQSAEGDCYNREHLVPQSSFDSDFPMQSDINHVIPTDGRVNNFRGSLPFGEVATADFTSLNGSKRGTSNVSGYSGLMFEPIDEFKGDIARALLYFAVRYEDTVDGYTSFDMFNGTNDEVFYPWAITLLLDWHYNVDPVDQRERDRNQAAYAFQNNTNPFVDHPEYADMIWNPTVDSDPPTAPTNLMASNPTVSTIDLSWTASSDNIGVTSYDVYRDGGNPVSTSNTSITITGLSPNTEYCFTVFARDAALNTSPSSNIACETTEQGSTTTNELFISEYIEGSSNNKAIEIANFTGNTVSLSSYTIARDVNSNGTWGASLQLTGSIANMDVHVITRGDASGSFTAVADQLSSGDAMSFNGNDPVGLFKNGTLIDIFGTFGGSNDYTNETYRRKPSVAGPSTAFDLSGEWDVFSTDNVDDLGSHSQLLSIIDVPLSELRIYPNPASGSNISIGIQKTINYKIYNVLGSVVKRGKSNNGKINIESLKAGVYLIQFNDSYLTVSKKLIRN